MARYSGKASWIWQGAVRTADLPPCPFQDILLTTPSVRAGGAELHNIAALTGGLVSQEVIKVITEQYIPVDNTCLFDGISSKSAVYLA